MHDCCRMASSASGPKTFCIESHANPTTYSCLLTMRDESHPGTIYFYSDAIGLGSNAACAMIMSLHNLCGVGGSAEARGCTLLAVGGVAQLLCAARSFRGERTLPRTSTRVHVSSRGLSSLSRPRLHLLPPLQPHPFHHCSHHRHTVSTTLTAQHTTTSLRRR